MKTSFALLLALASAAAISAPSVAADSFKPCGSFEIPGWKKEWRALPSGGKALTLKNRAKAIKTNACSLP